MGWKKSVALAVLLPLLSGSHAHATELKFAPPSLIRGAAAAGPAQAYRVGAGDKLRLIVFGEENLSGEFVVDGQGALALPLIGQVQVANLTTQQAEQEITAKLKDGYLKDPRVNIEVLNFRPIYIYGEVNKPDKYPYADGMTILNAVAQAGGFTYRAKTDRVFVMRGNVAAESEVRITPTTKIQPGDVIRIPERYF